MAGQKEGWSDINVGQIVQGSVYTNTLVLHIGDEPHPMWQIETGKLAELRDTQERLLKMRRAALALNAPKQWPMVATSAVFGLSLAATATVVERFSQIVFPAAMVAFVCMIGVISTVVDAYRSQRRERKAIAYLEDVLARMDAELDMRTWGVGKVR